MEIDDRAVMVVTTALFGIECDLSTIRLLVVRHALQALLDAGYTIVPPVEGKVT